MRLGTLCNIMHHLEAIEQVVHTISKCDFEHLTTRVAFIETSVRKGSTHSKKKMIVHK